MPIYESRLVNLILESFMKRFKTSLLAVVLTVGLSGCSDKEYTPKEVAENFINYAKDGDSKVFDFMTEENINGKIIKSAYICTFAASKVDGLKPLCIDLESELQKTIKDKENIAEIGKEITLILLPLSYTNDDTDFIIDNNSNDENKATAKNSKGTILTLEKIDNIWKVSK